MRIDRLDLIAYGQFTDKTLDLSEGSSGLHLIYGDNEAGKSTSLRALIALLFGIPPRTQDNYLHLNQQLRIGGKLRLNDGSVIEFIRRKGIKGTVLDYYSGSILDDALLDQFLAPGIDKILFEKLYGINHARLVAGGLELLNQAGDIGQALFSAAAGTENLREILYQLQDESDSLFKPQASSKIINQAISHFRTVNKRMKESMVPVSRWERLNQDYSEKKLELDHIDTIITEKNKEKSRLARIGRVCGALAERRSLMKKLETYETIQLLSTDVDDTRRAILNRLVAANSLKEKTEAHHARLVKELDSISVDDEIVKNEAIILQLYKELGAVEKTVKDRPQQDGKRRLLRTEAHLLLKSIRHDVPLEEAERLRPLLNNRRWISTLAKEYIILSQRQDELKKSMEESEEEIKTLIRQRKEDIGPGSNLEELQHAVARVRKQGNVEVRLQETADKASESINLCRRGLTQLGRFSKSIEELQNVAMPVLETLDLFEKQLDENEAQLIECRRQIELLTNEYAEAKKQLQLLMKTESIPSATELQELRFLRDELWQRIKITYIDEIPNDSDRVLTSEDQDLPDTFETKLREADLISDQLRLTADKVVKRADLETTLNHLDSSLDSLEKKRRIIAEERSTCQQQWQAIWESRDIEPGSPREMKQWLLQKDHLIQTYQSSAHLVKQEQTLRAIVDELKDKLIEQLGNYQDCEGAARLSLEELASRSEHIIKKVGLVVEHNLQIEHAVARAQNRLQRIHKELDLINRENRDWKEKWLGAVEGLHVEKSVHPEQVVDVMDQLVSFFDYYDKSEALGKRIYGMDQVRDRFVKSVIDFAESIAFEHEGAPAESVVVRFNEELSRAKELRARKEKIRALLKELNAEIEDTNITIRLAEDQMAQLMSEAGVNSKDALADLCDRSAQKRELLEKLERLEQELSRHGDGLSISELEHEAASEDFDSIDAHLSQVTQELSELGTQRDRIRDQLQTTQTTIQTIDSSQDAANDREELEQLRATIISSSEQYLRTKLAALILEQMIEEYRKKNQAPVLIKTSDIFSRLTMGLYRSLRDELDEKGKPFLLAIRDNNMEVPVQAMSDGTRDQLFLALRLATLEQHLEIGEPMPFIVDDILIGFDDQRTLVGLQLLAELSARTQVLLFTHHRRILELSTEVTASEGIYLQEL